MRILCTLMACFFALPVAAQEVLPCGSVLGGDARPSNMSAKAYENGSVKFAVVHDGRKDGTAGLFIAVFSPSDSANEGKRCSLIGRAVGEGYTNIALAASDANFDRESGLTVKVPARIYLPEEGFTNATVLSINVNQRTQTVTVEQELAIE